MGTPKIPPRPMARSGGGTTTKNPQTVKNVVVLADQARNERDVFILSEWTTVHGKPTGSPRESNPKPLSDGTPMDAGRLLDLGVIKDERSFSLTHVRPGGAASVVFEEKSGAEMVGSSADPPVRRPYLTREPFGYPDAPGDDDLSPQPTRYLDIVVPEASISKAAT